MTDTLDDMLAGAAHRGMLDANYALAYGGVMDAPLSGEWVDQLTPRTLALELGYAGDDHDDIGALADAYEEAYFARVAEDGTPDEAHAGHVMPLTGAWYCDTCESPYCDNA